MDNNSITKHIALFLIVLLLLSVAGNLYLNWRLHLVGVELENSRLESEEADRIFNQKQEHYDRLDSTLSSSLSARIQNTYITNIIKNEESKKDIISMDSASTDSLFAIDFAWAKQRYKYLFNY